MTTLEREMSALKARVAGNEEDMQSIPDLIKAEFRLTNSQLARLSRDIAELRGDVAGLRGLPAVVDALPRAVAEVVVELLSERDKKS